MKATSDVIACVVDHGLVGVPMATRLAEGMKKVYVFSDWEEGMSTINKAIVGDGFETIERVRDIWSIKDEVDLFVFPDVQKSGLQLELESQGKAVWGSRKGDKYELDRELFLRTLKEVGLDVPPYTIKVGLAALSDFLHDKEDYYIKVSLFRGSFETCHWRSWELDRGLIALWELRFGPAGEDIHFLCFPDIDTPLEIGADTFSIDGQWPNLMLHGVEWKDKCYLGAVTQRDDMPPQIKQVLEAFGPLMKRERYRNQFSMECRVKKPNSYFIDFTARMGLPSTGSQLRLWSNWPEIVWHGANGELVQPKANGKYSAEAIVTCKGDSLEWRTADVDPKLRPWLMLADCFECDGHICFPPSEAEEVGWLVAIADTPEQVIKEINKEADMLPDGMDANVEHLGYVLKECHTAIKQGIAFGKLPVPKPETVFAS